MPPKPEWKTTPKLVTAARSLRHDQTSAEAILWDALRDRGLHGLKFRRQHPVDSFVLDFFNVTYQLAIEIDGTVHHREDQQAYDQVRTQSLAAKCIRVLRFSNDEITSHLGDVLQTIDNACQSPPPSPEPRSGEGGREGEVSHPSS
jgi:very-short-patch-repair endonuclease